MNYVYVLRSLKNKKRYVGVTTKTPLERLKEHNAGSNIFTRHNGTFELIYSEECESKSFAIKKERFLKSGNGRAFLDKKINRPIPL